VAKASQAIKAIVVKGSHCGHSLPSKLQPQPVAEGSHSNSSKPLAEASHQSHQSRSSQPAIVAEGTFELIKAIGRSQPSKSSKPSLAGSHCS